MRPDDPSTTAHAAAANRAVAGAACYIVACGFVVVILGHAHAPGVVMAIPWLCTFALVTWILLWARPQSQLTWTRTGTGLATTTPVAGALLAKVVVTPTGVSGTGHGAVVAYTVGSVGRWRSTPCTTSATDSGAFSGAYAVTVGGRTVIALLPVRVTGRPLLGVGAIPDTPR